MSRFFWFRKEQSNFFGRGGGGVRKEKSSFCFGFFYFS
jgi:hypothetical protein